MLWVSLLAIGCTGTPAPAPVDDEPAAASATPKQPNGAAKDAGFNSTPAKDSGLGVLSFSPPQAYSGFDGEHSFKVPIAVYDASDDLTVTATDPSAASIASVKLEKPLRNDGTYDNGRYFMVTIQKSGTITLIAQSQGRKVQATINVAAYTSDAWTAGEARYTNGGTNGDPPCTMCHAGSNGIDHSPAALAGATDAKIGAVITTGISTAGFPINATKGHRWTVTPDERDALITYLRGLEPRGFE